MTTLHLTLKKKWFDMIASGEKKEEYREIKPYWINRLLSGIYSKSGGSHFHKNQLFNDEYRNIISKQFDQIYFKNGYSRNSDIIVVECLGIEIGEANPEWSDNWPGEVFIIKLGKIL